MKDLVDYLARALVDDPAPVVVDEELRGEGETREAVYKLKVGKDDLGKVIGKKGRTAKALRTLLAAAGAKQNLRVSLEIVEPEGDRRGGRSSAPAAPEEADAEGEGEEAAS